MASADLMICVFPPRGLIVEIGQLVPHLICRGAFLHIDRNGIILDRSVCQGDRVPDRVGEVHHLAGSRADRCDVVARNDRDELGDVGAVGHDDRDGVRGVIHDAR